MPVPNSTQIMLALIALWIVVTVVLIVGASIIFLRRSSDGGLIGLSVLACIAALVFAPLLRVTPEQYGLYLFLAGFFPIAGAITAAVVTSAVQLLQTRRGASLPGLLLSLGAAGLMVVNLSTPWIWPYARY
jgi:hypothetical protein